MFTLLAEYCIMFPLLFHDCAFHSFLLLFRDFYSGLHVRCTVGKSNTIKIVCCSFRSKLSKKQDTNHSSKVLYDIKDEQLYLVFLSIFQRITYRSSPYQITACDAVCRNSRSLPQVGPHSSFSAKQTRFLG